MAVYEITNVENTGPTSHKKNYQKGLYSIHRKTQRDPNVLTKTFLVDKKKWDSNSDDYKLSHICENSGLINSVKSNYLWSSFW